MTTGERIKQKREELKMSQSEVARHMQALGFLTFYQMTTSRTEQSERQVSLMEAVALSAILGVTLDWLAGEDDGGASSTSFQAGYATGVRDAATAVLGLQPTKESTA